MVKTETKQLISKEMTIGEVISKYPETAEIMTSYGLHCVGCGVNPYESIGDGCTGHGMDEDTLNKMMNEINKIIEDKDNNKGKTIIITNNAIKELKILMKNEKKEGYGLKLKIDKNSMGYELDFADKKEVNEIILKENDIEIYINKENLELLKGTEIDYVKNERGEGFKINNPNIKKGGCGSGCGCSN